ncbi:MAG: hypothetical protein ACOC2E_07660 [Bacteroidota bacterium]
MLLLAATQKKIWNILDKKDDETTHEELMEAWVHDLHGQIPVELNSENMMRLKEEWISTK